MIEEAVKEIQKESPKDLYEYEILRFQDLLSKDQKYAFQRYGWTLLYSMESDKTFQIMQEMGWKGKEPLDFYNIGALQCQEDNIKEALKNFEKAESMGCDRPELFFNMAVIFEGQDDKARAKQYYQKYIDATEQWDDIPKSMQLELDEVRDHMKAI